MNKSKMILVAIGGVFGVLSLAMAYLVWSAVSEKNAALEGDEDEGTDGLEAVLENVSRLTHKAVYPSAENVKKLDNNRLAFEEWQEDALQQVNHGDRTFAPTTPAMFKAKIIADTTNAVYEGILKPDFAFGPFRPYIREGMLPQEKDLPLLQRQWYDLTSIITNLAASGIAELVDIQLKADEEAAAARETAATGKKARGKGAKSDEDDKASSRRTRQIYALSFTTRPAGFVQCINALAKMERFTVVEDFSLTRPKDAIAQALTVEKADESKAAGGGRRFLRRAAREAEEKAAKAESKQGVVTDPAQDEPFLVTLTVSVYDFGSREGGETAPEGDKEEK